MKFKEALDEVLDNVLPKVDGIENAVTPQTAKILAILWNMMAVSQNVLDDTVYIDKNNAIISNPLQKSTSKKTVGKTKVEKPIEEVKDNNEGQPTTSD